MVETPYGYKQAHRLVMLTFKPIPNAEGDLLLTIKNHNKRCNELNNLEWITREENQKRARADLYIDLETPTIPYKNKYSCRTIKFEKYAGGN